MQSIMYCPCDLFSSRNFRVMIALKYPGSASARLQLFGCARTFVFTIEFNCPPKMYILYSTAIYPSCQIILENNYIEIRTLNFTIIVAPSAAPLLKKAVFADLVKKRWKIAAMFSNSAINRPRQHQVAERTDCARTHTHTKSRRSSTPSPPASSSSSPASSLEKAHLSIVSVQKRLNHFDHFVLIHKPPSVLINCKLPFCRLAPLESLYHFLDGSLVNRSCCGCASAPSAPFHRQRRRHITPAYLPIKGERYQITCCWSATVDRPHLLRLCETSANSQVPRLLIMFLYLLNVPFDWNQFHLCMRLIWNSKSMIILLILHFFSLVFSLFLFCSFQSTNSCHLNPSSLTHNHKFVWFQEVRGQTVVCACMHQFSLSIRNQLRFKKCDQTNMNEKCWFYPQLFRWLLLHVHIHICSLYKYTYIHEWRLASLCFFPKA